MVCIIQATAAAYRVIRYDGDGAKQGTLDTRRRWIFQTRLLQSDDLLFFELAAK
jgi:hypothetical protein